MVTGNHRKAVGLQISFEKNPIPTLPHTPMASRVDMTKLLMSPPNSARAPAWATPSSKVAPGMGIFAEKEAVHVLPALWLIPNSEAHARYPKFAGEAQGRTHADAPIEIKFWSPIVHVRSPPNRASRHVQKFGRRKLFTIEPQILNAVGRMPAPKSRISATSKASTFTTASVELPSG